MKGLDKKSHNNFINRELSWLEFNGRVLEEAQDKNNPLFERLKFLSIVSSNFDEFFMVRVGSLWDQIQAGFNKKDPAELTPGEQLDRIYKRAYTMMKEQYSTYNEQLCLELKNNKIIFLSGKDLNDKQKKYIKKYYKNTIYPVITPIMVDKSRIFPLILNKSLNIALMLKNKKDDDALFGIVQVPAVLDRYIEIPSEHKVNRSFILMEEIIKLYLHEIFRGHEIIDEGCFRITRNADLSYDEEGAEDLLEAIEESIKRRKWGAVIRLEIEKGMNGWLINKLRDELEIPEKGIYEIKTPIDLTFFMKFSSMKGFEHLKYESHIPVVLPELQGKKNILDVVSKKDILLHHPYQSFKSVVKMVQQAAVDPDVLAIKQTLYRVSGNSPIVEALAAAAENGKQVTVLVELKARFDEENNIIWARRLERAGCHVIYGLVGLKTHCKILLIVRREENGIKRYVHMGTGNYNDVTARLYTDLGLITSNPYFGADASALFNMISGYTQFKHMNKVDIAPLTLREKLLSLISRETENASKGKKSILIAKFNSLVDKQIIEALYKASSAGAEIHLIVRGICCLRPGMKGVSENITVRSIVGRYLEHTRIYYFYNDGAEEVFLSSADWMDRNLDRRVELLFPIEDTDIRDKLKNILDIYLKDNVKARILNSDGSYSRVNKKGKKEINSQEYFNKVNRINTQNFNEKNFTFQPIRDREAAIDLD